MENVGYATLTIIPSAKNFTKLLGRDVDGPLSKQGTDSGKRTGGAFVGAFKGLVGPALAVFGGQALVGFAGSAIQAAGDLEQSIGAVDTVFKGNSAQIHNWAKNAAVDLGLTRNEYNELGTLIATQLKNGGTAMDELGPKTNELIGLGADLSSMFGGSTTEAVEALSSALKGERDPIERFGVSLTQAAIDAKAAEMGFQKVGGALSAEANQAATLALIMDQTTDAHGNFARETETFSHQQQVLIANWGNIKTAIGNLFIPAATAALTAINKFASPIQTWVEGLSEGGGAFERLGGIARGVGETFAPVWDAVKTAIGPLIPQVVSLASSFSPLSLVLQAIGPVLPQLASTLSILATTIGGALFSALNGLTPLIQQIVSVVTGTLIAIMPAITAALMSLSQAFISLIPVIMPLISTLLSLAATLISQLAPIFGQLVNAILPPLVSIFGNVVMAVAPLVSMLAGLLIPVIQALMPVVVTVFGVIANVITSAMQIIQGVIQVVTGVISGNWGQVWEGMKNILSGIWSGIKAIVSGALSILGSLIVAALSLIRSTWTGAWNGLKGIVSGAWSGIRSGVSSGISSMMGLITSLPGRITGALGNLGGLLVNSGQSLIQGFIDGINNMIGKVTGAASSLVSKVRDFFPFSPAKRGPFSGRGYTTYSGKALTQDFARSIAGNAGAVTRAASLVASRAQSALSPSAPSFRTPTVEGGGYSRVAGGTAGGSPLVGSLTLQSTGDTKDDLNETMFHLRRIARGGVYA